MIKCTFILHMRKSRCMHDGTAILCVTGGGIVFVVAFPKNNLL